MKKSVLIVSHALEIGGAERSLIGLLGALNPEQWDIDLFLLRHEGDLLEDIPEYVNLLPQVSSYTVLARPMKAVLKEGHILLTAARLLGKAAAGLYDSRHGYTDSAVALEYSHKFTCKFMPEIQRNKKYDLAISFLTPHYFAAQKVNAVKKIAWIHTDYSNVCVNVKSEAKMWDAYDAIVSISEAAAEGFVKTFPKLKNKVTVMENILPEMLIRKQAEVPIEDMKRSGDEIILLSIGRFSYAKNFDNIPEICSLLRNAGLPVKWYLIGYGGDEQKICKKIAEAGMEEYVIVLGKRSNPYPYIKACDLYVQPSRYEGKCVTVREAQLLGKPVVITRYNTSSSQLEDGVDGVIVPMDNVGCAGGIAELLRDGDKIQQLKNVCAMRDYSKADEADKLYRLI